MSSEGRGASLVNVFWSSGVACVPLDPSHQARVYLNLDTHSEGLLLPHSSIVCPLRPARHERWFSTYAYIEALDLLAVVPVVIG
ncbi:hypothetical protein K469DRAFT_179610 [Zopfia rhizophila CBS 207.26]|uniref:Uncharacterized protein n=1 Tax=Zopfia rhizophila CBS 207.26 TaxID=1314779 RepID=A0A6A6DX38_9PEZI|nr:hypothetical protein K469DRAFT_179610 [Zopfia rhizophila CBS 207.26]